MDQFLNKLKKSIMSKGGFSLLMLLFISHLAYSQTFKGFCGTSLEDQAEIKARMLENRANLGHIFASRSGAPTYVPITYHLVAKDDGTGRLKVTKVFENLCKINDVYKDQNIIFYLKNINFINNTFLYDDPSSAFGESYAKQFNSKNRNAINLFCAKIANGGNTDVLAFYTPGSDYLVTGIERGQLNDGYVLGHEIGHFFSLNHTFYGWEGTTYNCNVPTPKSVFYNNQNILVEYVDRAKLLNGNQICKLAADGFCDTPADYNLGFGFNGCNYNLCAKDPLDVPLDPDEKNIMSYFLNCHQYFSQEQKNAIAQDLLSSKRGFLRIPVYNPLPDVASNPIIVEPTNGTFTNYYDKVLMKWQAVPNATHYVIEYGETVISVNPKYLITTRTDTTLTFLPNKKYAWRVFAYNPNSFCNALATPMTFTSGKFNVATNDLNPDVISSHVYATGLNQFNLIINSNHNSEGGFKVFNAEGKLISNQILSINAGENNLTNTVPNQGVYFYQLILGGYTKSGKIIID